MAESLPILLVDDEAEFVETLAERLELRGFEVAVALGGEAALNKLEKLNPNCIVLDLKMPGMSGLEVLRETLRRRPDQPVIMLTGHGSDLERDEALALGAKNYLQKPVDIDSMVNILKETIHPDAASGV